MWGRLGVTHARVNQVRGAEEEHQGVLVGPTRGGRSPLTCSLHPAVSGDALQLVTELLKIFVVGELRDPSSVLLCPTQAHPDHL